MRSLALTVLLAGCVQPVPDSGARYTLTHYLAEIRLEDRPMTYDSSLDAINAALEGGAFPRYISQSVYRDGKWVVSSTKPKRGPFVGVEAASLESVHLEENK